MEISIPLSMVFGGGPPEDLVLFYIYTSKVGKSVYSIVLKISWDTSR